MPREDDQDRAAPEAGAVPKAPGPEERVGYGHPPKATRFKPGRSGNPKGRPKGAQGRKTIVEQVLLERHDVIEAGERKQRTTLELILLTLRHRAFEGDPKAFKALQELEARFGPQEPKRQGGYIVVPEVLTEEEWIARYSPKNTPSE